MASGGYVDVNGVARKIKAGYVGVNGVARKIKAGYVGVDGVARQIMEENAGGRVMIIAVDGTTQANVWEGKVDDILAGTVGARAVTLPNNNSGQSPPAVNSNNGYIAFFAGLSTTILVTTQYRDFVSNRVQKTLTLPAGGLVLASATHQETGRSVAVTISGCVLFGPTNDASAWQGFRLPSTPSAATIGSVDFTSNGYCVIALGQGTSGYVWRGTPGFTAASNFTLIASGTSAPQTIAVGKDNVAVGINSSKQVIRYPNLESSTSGTTVATLSSLVTPARVCGDKAGGRFLVSGVTRCINYVSKDNGVNFATTTLPYVSSSGASGSGVNSMVHSEKAGLWASAVVSPGPSAVGKLALSTDAMFDLGGYTSLAGTKTSTWTSAAIMDL